MKYVLILTLTHISGAATMITIPGYASEQACESAVDRWMWYAPPRDFKKKAECIPG